MPRLTMLVDSLSLADQRPDGLSRVEDRRLLTGRGLYVHDVTLPFMLHAVFVRSNYARAQIISLDFQPALNMEGVVAVFDDTQLSTLSMPPANPLLPLCGLPNFPLLARGRVNYVGQPIAVVVARSLSAAQRAAELVLVDYASESAQSDGAEDTLTVASVRHQAGVAETAQAVHKVRMVHSQARVIAMSLEPRAVVAQWDAFNGVLTAWLSTQTPARARTDIANTLGLPTSKVRVIAPDVGGAFGAKASVSPEDLVIAFVARHLLTSVKWTSSRSDEFTSSTHGRGARLEGELWLDEKGRFLHLKALMNFPVGAWLAFSAVVPARNAARILPGPYLVSSVDIAAHASMANATAVHIYRGAGRPEAALLIERLVEMAARQSGIDPVELRIRNLYSSMPYTTPTGERLSPGEYRVALERACAHFDYAHERREQIRRRAAGEMLGIGLAMYIEPCGQGWESARVSLLTSGRVEVASGSASQGQGHQTSYATIAAKALGCDPTLVTVFEGDTKSCPAGIGALASRSMAIGGSAVLQAAMEAARRRDAGESMPIVVDTVYTAAAEAWSYGCVIVRMAIDPETGKPHIERLVWVDDAGRIISPQLAEGQLLGGLAQGLGQAMLERIVYDDEGQLLTGSLMDYAIPRADDMPLIELETLASITNDNILGAKGVGEAGCIGVPAALLNAAADALSHLGEKTLNFPLTAEHLWRAMQAPHGDLTQ